MKRTVVCEYVAVWYASRTHHGSTNLAQSHAMSPSSASQDKLLGELTVAFVDSLNDKS